MSIQRHPAQDDFRVFMFMVWRHLNLPEPTPVQYDIANYLQKGPRRSVIEAFRGVGKSWITSAYVCWELWRDPQQKIEVVSASKDRADAFSSFVKRLINEIPVLQHLKPNADQRDSVISFDVGPALPDHSPSVKSVGITGQLTGSRADILIADDIEVPNNSATQAMRDKLSEAVKEFDAILKPGGRIIYLGTPQTEMSLYNQLPERGYEIRIWPALFPELKDIIRYQGRLAPMITLALEKDAKLSGAPVDPRRFDEKDLAERKASYGRSGFALQFMLDTSLSDGDRYPLKIQDLIVQSLDSKLAPMQFAWARSPELTENELPTIALTGDRFYRPMWKSPEVAEYTGCVMAIDPSGRGKDETGYAIVKILAGNLFLVAAGGLLGGYEEETLERLAKLAKIHNVNHVIVEPNFGDGMYTKLLTPIMAKHHKCLVEDAERATGQKELRICDVLEPILNNHKLVVDPRVIEEDAKTSEGDPKYSLFYQLTRITRDKGALAHDDRLDALAIAVAYWTEHMSRDNQKAMEQYKAKQMDNELKDFMKNTIGKKPKAKNWMGNSRARR